MCALKGPDIDSRDFETPPAVVEVDTLPFNSEKGKAASIRYSQVK